MTLAITRRGGQDPKREAQEAAARGNWRPTDQMLRKADPDFVKRFFINEAVKRDLRQQYVRAVQIDQQRQQALSPLYGRPGLGEGHKVRGEGLARAQAFWMEYGSLDDRWIGDLADIKAAIAKEM